MRHHLGFRKKNKIKSKLYSIPVLILLFIILILIAKGTFNIYQRAKLSKERLMVAEAKMVELSKREDFISGKINKLNTNTGIEEEIREKFNVVKEGEEMIVIINNGEDDLNMELKEKTFWQKVFPWLD